MQIYADKYTPVDTGLIPTGKREDVKNTAFDFNTPTKISEGIETENEQLKNAGGYDHNYVLNETRVKGLNHAARGMQTRSIS